MARPRRESIEEVRGDPQSLGDRLMEVLGLDLHVVVLEEVGAPLRGDDAATFGSRLWAGRRAMPPRLVPFSARRAMSSRKASLDPEDSGSAGAAELHEHVDVAARDVVAARRGTA
jgi:hypothetical protein